MRIVKERGIMMKRKLLVVIMAAALMCSLLAGCKSMSDEMMDAVNLFTEQVTRITDQTAEAGKLVEQAEELLTSGKPVSDVTTTSRLQSVVEEVKEKVTFEVPKRPSSLNAINEKVEELKNIDFTSYLTKLKEAIKGVVSSQEDYEMNDTLVTKENGTWGVFNDGKLDESYNGLATNEYGTWYIKDGAVDFSYSGQVDFAGQTFTVEGGKVVK